MTAPTRPRWRAATAATADGAFEVWCAGSGPPVVVAHGYATFGAGGDPFAAALSRRAAVYLVNLRGAGASPPPRAADDLSMARAAADLEAVRRALGVGPWTVAGHSTGGMIALTYALAEPSAVSGLVLVGTAASNRYATLPQSIYAPEHPGHARMQHLLRQLARSDLDPGLRRRLAAARTALSLYRPEPAVLAALETAGRGLSAARLAHYSRADFPRYDLTADLGRVACPAWVACGRHDPQCPLACSEELAAGIPDAELSVFEASGHYPFVEEAARFDRAWGRFVARLAVS